MSRFSVALTSDVSGWKFKVSELLGSIDTGVTEIHGIVDCYYTSVYMYCDDGEQDFCKSKLITHVSTEIAKLHAKLQKQMFDLNIFR